MKVVFDTSAVIKWFLKEKDSEKCREIRNLHIEGKVEIHSVDFMLVELSNVLRYAKGISKQDVVEAIEAIKALDIKLVSMQKLLKDAIDRSFTYNLTVYDALYIALSEKLEAPLITYDMEILQAFEKAIKASEYLTLVSKKLRRE